MAKEKDKCNFFNLAKREQSMQPCPIGLQGKCCKNCLMGPCRVVTKEQKGVCGASQDVVVSRNLLRFAAAGASCHVGHAYHLKNFLGKDYPKNYIEKKAPPYLYKLWRELGIVPVIHFEHFKDISEALHASTMGVDADYTTILKRAMRMGIVDGYYGLYLATELEDEIYGKPEVKKGILDLGVIKKDKVNIAVHGHEPMLAIALAQELKKKENKDINLIGVCCTGASVLARYGIPMAANFVLQEDVIASGAIEAMVVDVQCIMPSLADLCECYHTKLITTNKLCRIPNALHLPFRNKNEAEKVSQEIIKIARENKVNRKEVKIENAKKEAMVGFTEDNVPLKEWSEKIKNGKLKGIIGVVGCVNPRVKEDWISCYKELSKNYVILTTGCMAFKLGQAGLLDGKRFFHMGSCVNNARIAEIFKRIAEMQGKRITDLPFLISCPMPITEKAIAIGIFFASIGVDVHFGYPFMISSDTTIAEFLENVLREKFESRVFLETSPTNLIRRIKEAEETKK
ncbi:MAG: hypothetical protein N3G19_01955 [Candidatus Pacearchaeota archaeon]|nr:hypothetical protein [Candidatus Pacearchaeota archaeon]